MTDWKKEALNLKATILVGLSIGVVAMVVFGGAGLIVLRASGDEGYFRAMIATIFAFLCIFMALFPLMGLIGSLSNKSWYALKFCLVTSVSAIVASGAITKVCLQIEVASPKPGADIESESSPSDSEIESVGAE